MCRMTFVRYLGCVALFLMPFGGALAQDEQLLRHGDYDKTAGLNIKQAAVQKRNGITIYDISFSSPVGDRGAAVGPNGGVVTAYLVVPPGGGRFPAVIFGHWCMPGSEKMNRTEFLDEAVVLAHSGVISLLPDHVIVHPGFVDDKTPLNDQQIAVEVQQDINLRRGADLLLARQDVDPARLLEAALRRVDGLLRAEPFVALRVAPAQEDGLRRALAALGQDAGWALAAAVTADPTLADGACVVATASGTLEIGVDAQLEAFRKAVEAAGSPR